MKEALVRFGVAMEASLLERFDAVVQLRGCTRSELFRDLARAELARVQARSPVPAVGTLTLVYDHHVRDLTERLTELQHELGEQVRSTLHIHLSHHLCLEVIVLQGRADELHRVADQLLATRGVKHGGLELVAQPLLDGDAPKPRARRASEAAGEHKHAPPKRRAKRP